MTSEPFTEVGHVHPTDPEAFVLRKDDYGAFRAVEPGGEVLAIRPVFEGLCLERPGGLELVPWNDVTGLTLSRAPAGTARVPTARVDLVRGPSIDFADALSPGAAQLGFALEPGGPMLLRVERFRLLCAAIVAGAELAAVRQGSFRRGTRELPHPELAIRPRVLPTWVPPLLLVASVVVLVLFFSFSLGGAIAITLVILAHEYGHVLAMRLSGMKVRGVLFLPFVGAATVPEHSFRSRWHEAWVHLAGPLTGLPVAGVALVLWQREFVPHESGMVFFWTALLLNLLNLVPLLPLDGGRVLLCMTAALPRALRAPATFAPLVALVVTLIVATEEPMALWVALLLAFSFFVTRLSLRRYSFHGWMDQLGVDLASLRTALRDVTYAFSGAAREDVDGGVPPSPLRADQVLLVFLAYAVEVVVLGGVSALALMQYGFGAHSP